MVDAFHSRRDLVVGLLKDSGIKINVPDFYVFPDVSSFFGKTLRGTLIKDANDFAMYL
jgi:aspartate aminotransferase